MSQCESFGRPKPDSEIGGPAQTAAHGGPFRHFFFFGGPQKNENEKKLGKSSRCYPVMQLRHRSVPKVHREHDQCWHRAQGTQAVSCWASDRWPGPRSRPGVSQ